MQPSTRSRFPRVRSRLYQISYARAFHYRPDKHLLRCNETKIPFPLHIWLISVLVNKFKYVLFDNFGFVFSYLYKFLHDYLHSFNNVARIGQELQQSWECLLYLFLIQYYQNISIFYYAKHSLHEAFSITVFPATCIHQRGLTTSLWHFNIYGTALLC
ncbi:hypothetical protein ACQRIU_006218 [Beauveria bassiana]